MTNSNLPNEGYFVPYPKRGWASGCLIAAALCSSLLVWPADAAAGPCSARQALQNPLKADKTQQAGATPTHIASARDVPTWKTIEVGSFPDSLALRNALDAAGCSTGDQAEEILARPTFTVVSRKMKIDLVAVTPAELGFDGDTVSLAAIYVRASQLGFRPVPAEVGPQLRLQYPDQPVGEFLTVGMEPIKTWSGEPVVLSVANGGAGLILIGQCGRASAKVALTSRFLFVRSQEFDGADLTAHR
jgi:hypothetical protein